MELIDRHRFRHPGGLVLLDELGKYEVPEIVTEAVKSKLVASNGIGGQRTKRLIEQVKTRPSSLREYVDHHRLYNQLQYACEQARLTVIITQR